MPEFDDDINEFFEERAGILEHLAGLPRVKAEALARAEAESFQRVRAKARADAVVAKLVFPIRFRSAICSSLSCGFWR